MSIETTGGFVPFSITFEEGNMTVLLPDADPIVLTPPADSVCAPPTDFDIKVGREYHLFRPIVPKIAKIGEAKEPISKTCIGPLKSEIDRAYDNLKQPS